MTDTPRDTALAFLLGQHLLPLADAETALRVAEKTLRDGLARLDAALAANDAAAGQEAGHALKGTLLNLGLDRLAGLTQHIHDAARHGDTDRCRALTRELATRLAPFFTAQ